MDVASLSTKELISIIKCDNYCPACKYEAAIKITKNAGQNEWITESIINEANNIFSNKKPAHNYRNNCVAFRPGELCPNCFAIVNPVPPKRVGEACICSSCKSQLYWSIKWINNRFYNQMSTPKAIFFLSTKKDA